MSQPDIVERLRAPSAQSAWPNLATEAAATIEALRGRNAGELLESDSEVLDLA